MKETVRPIVVLTTICVTCAALLAFAQQTLGPRVEQQTDLYIRGPALERLFDQPAEEVLSNRANFSVEGVNYPLFFTTEGDQVTALAVEIAGQGGYGGDVVMLLGIDPVTEQFLGMEVVSHSETPGLGARIEEQSFRNQWVGLSVMERVELTSRGGTIDGITGATITSAAVVDGTNRLVDFILSHEGTLDMTVEFQQNQGGKE